MMYGRSACRRRAKQSSATTNRECAEPGHPLHSQYDKMAEDDYPVVAGVVIIIVL